MGNLEESPEKKQKHAKLMFIHNHPREEPLKPTALAVPCLAWQLIRVV